MVLILPKELLNGVEIFYQLDGGGSETLVLLNGIMMNTADWYGFVPLYTKEYRLLRVDFRNQGQSQYVEESFNIEIHVEDLKALLDKLSIEKVHMLGISYGGKVAMLFAIKYQNMLQSLILCNTTARVTKHLRDVEDSWINVAMQYDGEKFFKLIMPYIYSPKFCEENCKWIDNRVKAFGRVFRKPWFDAFTKLVESSHTYNILDKINGIKVPTLCIASEFDMLTPIIELTMVQEHIDKSELVIICNAGHAPQFENKMEFNKVVLNFLRLNNEKARLHNLCP
jgi:pimeloyl-ACP methyl ester carboxylesterase